ncbi:hypothetical protein Tco_1106175 [Tanacetum coccineum]
MYSTSPQKIIIKRSKMKRSRVGLVIGPRSCGGAGIACPRSDMPLVGKSLAADEGAVECLISTSTGIHKLRHTTDHPGGNPSLLGNRALNHSSQAHNILS